MRSREDLFPAEPKIEAFLTDLALHGNVAPATQNDVATTMIYTGTTYVPASTALPAHGVGQAL